MHTKTVFDLAEIYSNAVDGILDAVGSDNYVPWSEQDMVSRAAEAEGISAVLAKLKEFGWKSPEMLKEITDRYEEEAKNLSLVIDDLSGEVTRLQKRVEELTHPNNYFTTSPLPFSLPERFILGEVANPIPEFPHWSDVPDGVKYRGHGGHDPVTYVNRDGARYVVEDYYGPERPSQNDEQMMQELAPFRAV